MRVVAVDQLADNYAYLIIDEATGIAAVVDVAEPQPVLAAVADGGAELEAILSTHHHYDHVGGNETLLTACLPKKLRVYGYREDCGRIPGATDPLDDGGEFSVGGLHGVAIFIPAHTRGHIAYYFADEKSVFTGDTLFAGGCGRLFEGDAAQMKASLERLAALPDDTAVYCGHEYTQSNLRFALTLEPNNTTLIERLKEVESLRAEGRATVPTSIALEKRTNPFLRSGSPELQASVRAQLPGVAADEVAIFAATRSLKDSF